MALLASHIPVLYCMLYYRGARHNYTSQLQRPSPDFSVDLTSKNDALSEETGFGRRSSTERPWVYHNRKIDLNKVCSNQQAADPKAIKATGHQDSSDRCTFSNPDEVRRALPKRFLSEGDLQTITSQIQTSAAREEHLSKIHYVVRLAVRPKKSEALAEALTNGDCRSCETVSRVIEFFHMTSNFSSWTFGAFTPYCSTEADCIFGVLDPCLGMIGYEVVTEVSDFKGVNFTVVNFNNGYQFIATGRCLNENAPCRVGSQARCKQIYKAHWTLVWTHELGAQLVAHEVPSHCECLNFGSAIYPISAQSNYGNVDTTLDIVSKP
ncbi:hypothetical protein Bpfe_000005 [Biomphalaria pfeifferi]|uniref:Spaetzle domain-containing protein n=1 Tax=Biomphalaria pfeifferi TaxID=112525 RepID=A0AAD8FM32_BIOPF|nr:hypothetical protein Bpfe_000005 [Biomphalaria pfeifferi]